MQWIKCSDRLPTEADGDWAGKVVTKTDDRVSIVSIDKVCKRYDEFWLAGACEREQQEQERSE